MSNQESNSKPETVEQPSGEGLSSSVLLGVVEPRWWECTLDQCPPGLFLFDGDYGFKTEYRDDNGPEAYYVENGEYFWGGTGGDKEARRNLKVRPVIICSPNVQDDLPLPAGAAGASKEGVE